MALLVISDIETASGTTISTAEIPRYQWYIDTVIAYIETYTGQTFSAVTNQVVICQSDRYGYIQFPTLTSISLVEAREDWLGTYMPATSGDYAFDGIDTIYGLIPYTTYRLTVSYGSDTPPPDVAGVATQLVLAGTGLVPEAIGGLTRYRVGNVMEDYGITEKGVVTLTSLMAATLQAHSRHTTTWRL